MNHWDAIRIRARQKHATLYAATGHDPSAAAILSAASTSTQFRRIGVPANDTLLYGAQATLHSGVVWFNKDVEPWRALFNQAHEYAHLWLHGRGACCTESDIDLGASEDKLQMGAQRVDGYSPHERMELEANVFAREFLLPGGLLRRWYLDEGLSAADIAEKVGMREGLVFHQLCRAILGTELTAPTEPAEDLTSDLSLDDSQKKAAFAKSGPVLVDAGPGTGKTRALGARVAYLLTERKVPPEKILALTYTNKAAEEMRMRVALVEPEKARRVWMGTFHSFGLELLRKYGRHIGISKTPKVIDDLDAQLLLERSLAKLRLHHYRDLVDPPRYLRDILSAISLAKDYLVTPADYRKLAEDMLNAATQKEEIETAEKAIEVARVYEVYQGMLEKRDLLDYGDLIFRSLVLLRSSDDIRSKVRGHYEHILVDEYQDVNTVGRLLLIEVAGYGKGLWVVGDARQAIYRFRGAAPINMDSFMTDFLGARVLPLKTNYRSEQVVVSAISKCSSRMSIETRDSFNSWKSHLGEGSGRVQLTVVDNAVAEAKELANEIKRQKSSGTSYGKQAVLCRRHDELAELGVALEREDVPVLYLGDFFERPVVRDLLSLLSLGCEGHGRALVRVAKFEEYQIPLSDVRELLALAREQKVYFPQALRLAEDAENISAVGRQKLLLLASHLEQLKCYNSPAWSVLMRYLFNVSNYLRPLITKETVDSLQKRLAIYQFLRFAFEMRDRFDEEGTDSKRTFLDYVRRLSSNSEEKQLRQAPHWANDIDAVRMLTVHASKGLEFDAVYLPGLVNGRFPLRRMFDPCPPPLGLIPDIMLNWKDEEEECLLFVALSRARNSIFLSHAREYAGKTRSASSLLGLIRSSLSQSTRNLIAATRRTHGPEPATFPPPNSLQVFSERDLEIYLECPRKYYYEVELRLGGRRSDNAYAKSHLCVHRVWQWIEEELKEGRAIGPPEVINFFEQEWARVGPNAHPYTEDYKEEALSMIFRTLDRRLQSRGIMLRPRWIVGLTYGRVALNPDFVERTEGDFGTSLLIERLRIGRAPKSDPDDDIYALYKIAADQSHPDAEHQIQVLYMSDGEVKKVQLNPHQLTSRIKKYDDAMADILQGKYHPRTNKRCPRCAEYFICPAAED
jgi:superfamily I DNA/RNA helicase